MLPISVDQTLDCRGLSCPMPVLKVGKALSRMTAGETLELLSTDPGTQNEIERVVARWGAKLVGIEQMPR